jgi:predicted thioesterase
MRPNRLPLIIISVKPNGLIPLKIWQDMISEGIIGEGKMKVAEEDTAVKWGSGSLPVFATPAMILLIERTASECLSPLLKEGESTVGTRLD